jgi:hypothetical protein
MTKLALISLVLCLSACDRDRPPAPTEEQSGQLDEAEAMLNDMAQNEEGATPAGAAPSNAN